MRTNKERLAICATKYFKFKSVLEDCFSRSDLAEMCDLSINTIVKIANGKRVTRCNLSYDEQAVIEQRIKHYDRVFKLVNFYNAKQSSSRIGMTEHYAYKLYCRFNP